VSSRRAPCPCQCHTPPPLAPPLTRITGRTEIIDTIAGNGVAGFCGDGGPATAACLNEPAALARSPDGTWYIADRGNARIRRVSPTGIISTVVGNGTEPHCGDGGLAIHACLSTPSDVRVTAAGLFVLDAGNGRLKFVNLTTGRIVTLIGGGRPEGDPACGVSDYGPPAMVCLSDPQGFDVMEAGHVIVADTLHHRVLLYNATSRVVSLLAGTGRPQLCGDGGPAAAACVNEPQDADLTADERYVFIADGANHVIRSLDLWAPNRTIVTVMGTGSDTYCGDGGPALRA
jgi:hypothetical protein